MNTTPELDADRPRQALAEDLLGYAPFSRAIAASIRSMSAQDGIVLAINGQWGSGKTSAANMVHDAIEKSQNGSEERISVVWFNPWWFSGQENLVKAFFNEVSSSLETKVSGKIVAGLKSVGKRVSGAKGLILAGADLLPGGAIAKALAEGSLSALEKLLGNDESLEQARAKFCEALRESGKKILVITDDIDRLPADEARQIFRLVKSVADLPNVIHLLLFDRETARKAVGEPADLESPEWLEKIVQAAFDLPPIIPHDLHRLFLSRLQNVVSSSTALDQTRWGNTFYSAVAPWLRTPRDVSRLLNVLSVSWPATLDNLDLTDFVALETLRVFEPRLHEFVRKHPESLTGLQPEHIQNKSDIGDQLLNLVATSKHKQVKSALSQVFPRLQAIWSNNYYTEGFAARWNMERRACSDRHFRSYFSFSVGDDALTRQEAHNFISNISDREATRKSVLKYCSTSRVVGGTRASILLQDLSTHIGEIPEEKLEEAVINLFDVADLFSNPTDAATQGFLSLPITWQLWWIVHPMIERLAGDRRPFVLERAIHESTSLSGIDFALIVISDQHGRQPGKQMHTGEQTLISEDKLIELESAMKSRLRLSAEDHSLLSNPGLIGLLVRWVELGDESFVRTWTDTLLANDQDVLALADAATSIGRAHSSGDYVSTEIPQVDRKALEKVLDVERLVSRVDEVSTRDLPRAQEIAAKFHAGLRTRF